MSFTSVYFLFIFLPIALVGHYLINDRLKNIFLLAVSLVFYAVGELKTIPLLLLSIAVNYLCALVIEKCRENKLCLRIFVSLMLVFNIGMLFVFKYFALTVESVNYIFGTGISVPSLALPIGISFFTFRAISYCLDVAFGTSKAQRNPLNTALYISFFPQLTMGPIQQYSDFEKAVDNKKISVDNFAYGVKRVIIGICKKLIISDGIAVMVDGAYGMGASELSVVLAWLGAAGYLIQLYFDFSGYCDIAIGLSRMFGFDCPENFDYPYVSKTVGEFWRRWHITLGSWLKDYLYTPVFRGLLKRKNVVTKKKFTTMECDIIALLVVWICCGAWHGAGVKFVIYGLYYYIFIVCERFRQDYLKRRAKKLGVKRVKETKRKAFLAHLYLIIAVLFGQVIFRAASLTDVFRYIGSMFGLMGNSFVDAAAGYWWARSAVFMILGIIFSVPVVPAIRKICDTYVVPNRIKKVLSPVIYIVLMIIGLSYAMTSTYQSFIYFNF